MLHVEVVDSYALEDGKVSRVEPRGVEPLTSAVQRRQNTLLEISSERFLVLSKWLQIGLFLR